MVSIREMFAGRKKTTFQARTDLLVQLDEETREPLKGPDKLGLEGFEEANADRTEQVVSLLELLNNTYIKKP